MRRHPGLRELSSDHHQALVQAHRLQRASHADAATRRTIIHDFLRFWHEHGQRHFCEEEQALLPFFARWGEMTQEPIQQMLREHALIRRDAQRLQESEESPDEGSEECASTCRALGEQLEAHVRLEERVVFPLIEAALPDEALAALPEVLAAWQKEADKDVGAVRTPKEEKPMSNILSQNTPDTSTAATSAASTPASNGRPALPGDNLQTHKMPGHWLLARLGKTVLRPGGLELTRRLLDALNIRTDDAVVEFAPGMGATAQLALAHHPALYVAVERDETAADNIRQKLDGPNREFRVGSADATGLPDGCASVVYGEAMLTMQTPEMKARIVAEAERILKAGGRYGIHELCLLPDDLDESTQRAIYQALSGSIHVGARPLRIAEWRSLLEGAGLKVVAEHHAPMELLEPARLIQDEGIGGALHIIWNALHDEEALARVREMRAVFRKYHDHLGAIVLVAQKG